MTDAAAPVLECVELSRVHGSGRNAVTALDKVSVRVHPGEMLAVMGPSGSGKSTLLHLAGGLDVATSGVVRVDGVELAPMTSAGRAEMRRRRVGYVFQELNLVASLTAAENVALPLELDGLGARRARRVATELLGEVGLGHLGDRYPDDLSGGEQQRVAIARALVGEKRLLLADEPTGALDSTSGEAVLRQLRACVDRGGAAVLVTHDARYAAWADRIVFLKDGRLVDDTGVRPGPEALLEEHGR